MVPVAEKLADYYIWTFPGSPVRIHLALAVVERLREIVEKANLDPLLCREKGGFLLGKRHPGRIEITDVEIFVPAEDRPHFVLTDSDKPSFQTALEATRASVVGYFRSDLRNGIRLAGEDLDLIRANFANPTDVFLIVHADPNGSTSAGFFFWDGGSIFSEASFMEFPFHERLLPAGQPGSVNSEGKPVRSGSKKIESQRPSKSAAWNRKWAWVSAGSVGLVAGGLIISPSLRSKQPVEPRDPAQSTSSVPRSVYGPALALSAQPEGKNVSITWDSQIADLSDARIAVLTIQDGNSQTEFPLTKAQLQSNKLIYPAKSGRLDVVLEVFSSLGKSTRESVIVAVSATPLSIGQPAQFSPLANAGAATPVSSIRVAVPFSAEQAPPVNRTFRVDLPTRRAAVREPLFSAPPQAATGTSLTTLPTIALRLPDLPPPPPRTEPSVDSHPAQQTEAKIPDPEPLIRPPVAIRQVKPSIPSNALAMVKQRVVIQIRVEIDQNGNVVKAIPITPAGGLTQYLASPALEAARQWRFQPARRGDTVLPSEMILNFVIGPK